MRTKKHIPSVNDKEFKCEMCGKSVSRKNNIKVHVESVHEGKKAFKYKMFDKNFSHKHHMNRHIVLIHEDRKDFKCEFNFF